MQGSQVWFKELLRVRERKAHLRLEKADLQRLHKEAILYSTKKQSQILSPRPWTQSKALSVWVGLTKTPLTWFFPTSLTLSPIPTPPGQSLSPSNRPPCPIQGTLHLLIPCLDTFSPSQGLLAFPLWRDDSNFVLHTQAHILYTQEFTPAIRMMPWTLRDI